MNLNEEEVFVKIEKKMRGGVGGHVLGRVGGGGVLVDVNEELKFLGKFKKKKLGGVWGVGSSGGVGNGVGVRVDVNEELKFWGKFQKKKMWGRGGRGGGSGRVWGGGLG